MGHNINSLLMYLNSRKYFPKHLLVIESRKAPIYLKLTLPFIRCIIASSSLNLINASIGRSFVDSQQAEGPVLYEYPGVYCSLKYLVGAMTT